VLLGKGALKWMQTIGWCVGRSSPRLVGRGPREEDDRFPLALCWQRCRRVRVHPGPTAPAAAPGFVWAWGGGFLVMEISEMLAFGVGQGTCSFVFQASKEKVGFLPLKDANADHLIGLCSSPPQNKNKEGDRSGGDQGNQSPLPTPKPPPFSCI